MITNNSFAKMEIYPGLCVIKLKDTNQIVGYVNKHPFDNGWFYFFGEFFSEYFNSEFDAINELCRHFMVAGMDRSFNKLGLLNDERYVKK